MNKIEKLGGLKDDEYLVDGLPYCKNCHTQRFYESPNGAWLFRSICECQSKKNEEELLKNAQAQRQSEFEQRQQFSLLGERYLNESLDSAIQTENTKEAYAKCRSYLKNSDEMLKNNIGLYLYGNCSSGKTHLAACLCNELVKKGYFCVYTNLTQILNEIKLTFEKGGSSKECDLIKKLNKFSFVFIDDLGKEFLGREFDVATAKWAEKILFEIINSRYNAQLPTIFTSNYSLSELSQKLALDDAIVERIGEMATRIIKIEGDDFRSIARCEKSKIAKNYGV